MARSIIITILAAAAIVQAAVLPDTVAGQCRQVRRDTVQASAITTSSTVDEIIAPSIRLIPAFPEKKILLSSISVASSVSVASSAVPSGTVNTALFTEGQPTMVPLPTGTIKSATSSLQPTSIGTSAAPSATPLSGNIFKSLSTGPPNAKFANRNDHTKPGVGLRGGHAKPIQTNKFYSNLYLDNQDFPVYTFPYSLRWVKGRGSSRSFGMGISHTESDQLVYGPGNPAEYYANPIELDSVILSATELQGSTSLTTDQQTQFGVNVFMSAVSGGSPLITLPLVQGMGFITGIYTGATVLLQSNVLFKTLSTRAQVGSAFRWTIITADGEAWLVYLIPDAGVPAPVLTLNNANNVQGPKFSGLVQVAKIKNPADTNVYDAHIGVFPGSGWITSSGDGAYTFNWWKGGDNSKDIIMFALPHHVESFDDRTKGAVTGIKLQTPTKGVGTAVIASTWTLRENLPRSMGFAPWAPGYQQVKSIPDPARGLIRNVLIEELNQDISAQTNLDSVYFTGKALVKFANLVYTAKDLLGDAGLSGAGLRKLQDAFASFKNGQNKVSLVYDNVWKGIVNPAGYKDPGLDYGNAYYNDHNFHYGYIVYTAAVIAYLDPAWLNRDGNKEWVDTLVRDFASPVDDDFFPVSRSFDWYHGHSWAAGLFASADGKNLESSSEDSLASHALKMWGKISGDGSLQARGSLMLAIQARSFQHYFLMQSNNNDQPARFKGNKAVGILFENKVHHTTYFGNKLEFVAGIHMMPIGPQTGLVRNAQFIREEWDTYFSNGRINGATNDWRSLIYGNLALVDPRAAWAYFSSPTFDKGSLEGGASRAWYLTIAATLGGV